MSIPLDIGFRMLNRARQVAKRNVPQYNGNAKQICSQIVKKCYNKDHFNIGLGHYNFFWIRDFSWCIKPLINLGYKKEVTSTLEYALNLYSRYNKITTSITTTNIPIDIYYFSPDSLPSLLYCLVESNNKKLAKKHKNFLDNQIDIYYHTVIDKETMLVKKHDNFSSIKDHCMRHSSCYDNLMIARLKEDIQKLKLVNFFKINYKNLIKDYFWNGSFFMEDIDENNLSGDANIFPYWLNIFNSRKMLKSSIEAIKRERLDYPLPLKFTSFKKKQIWQTSFVPNAQGTSIWTNMGLIYIGLVKKIDKNEASRYLDRYKEIIEKNKNFVEIFNENEEPFKTFFYHSDDSMLWASMYLDLVK